MKKSLQQIISILFFCFSSFLFSQNQVKIDSLENALAKAKTDSIKADVLNELMGYWILFDVEKANTYNDQLFNLAKKTNNNYVYCRTFYAKSHYYTVMQQYDSALLNMKSANQYAVKSSSSKMMISTNVGFGYIFNFLRQPDSALVYINKAIELSEKHKDELALAEAQLIRGQYFFRQKKMDMALQDYLVADSIYSKHPDRKNSLAITQLYIAGLYAELVNLDKTEEYALRGQQTGKEINSERIIIEANVLLAYIDYERKDFTAAEEKYKRLMSFYTSLNDINKQADVNWMLGRIKMEQNNFKEAKKYYIQALETRRKTNNLHQLYTSVRDLGTLALKEKNYAESRQYFIEALDISKKTSDLKGEVECSKKLAEVSFLTQDYKSATEYYQAYIPLQDSLHNRKNIEKTQELETKYQTAQKQQQIELLSAENQLGKQKRKNQFMVFASLIGLLLIVGLALAFAYRNKLKTSRKIRELNQMKSRFFANISHEFRTPLTLIKSPLQNLQAEIQDENQQKKLSLIDRNSDRMLELVNQLLELSKIDSGKLKLILKEGNISSSLKSVVEPFEYQAKEKNLKFSSTIEHSEKLYSYDKDVVEKIVTNLLSNAVKYTPENHKIDFISNIENETLKLNVSNSGTDLKNKDIPKLFERFHQNDEQQEGFGIGLALIKELVDLYKGKIETSLNDDVLNFEVILPLTKNESENIVISNENSTDEIQNTEIESDNELPVLLVVDDNAEIRNILKDIFSDRYIVLEAEDGNTALELAQKEIPDCIISDVMMPKMDGFQFTQAIKENELTSFIPVILLTAKSSNESRLESLKNEADAFLTKPFNNEILKETVHRQIAERRRLQQRYSRELILKPVDIAINTVDEKFLEKVEIIMEKNLSNPGFSTNEFASEIGMSRMQLYRKLKSLLNLSPTEFIRNQRLKTAAELMKKGNKNVSEIAYSVGFNDVSYFSKCFKELYKTTPSEYISDISL